MFDPYLRKMIDSPVSDDTFLHPSIYRGGVGLLRPPLLSPDSEVQGYRVCAAELGKGIMRRLNSSNWLEVSQLTLNQSFEFRSMRCTFTNVVDGRDRYPGHSGICGTTLLPTPVVNEMFENPLE